MRLRRSRSCPRTCGMREHATGDQGRARHRCGEPRALADLSRSPFVEEPREAATASRPRRRARDPREAARRASCTHATSSSSSVPRQLLCPLPRDARDDAAALDRGLRIRALPRASGAVRQLDDLEPSKRVRTVCLKRRIASLVLHARGMASRERRADVFAPSTSRPSVSADVFLVTKDISMSTQNSAGGRRADPSRSSARSGSGRSPTP